MLSNICPTSQLPNNKISCLIHINGRLSVFCDVCRSVDPNLIGFQQYDRVCSQSIFREVGCGEFVIDPFYTIRNLN